MSIFDDIRRKLNPDHLVDEIRHRVEGAANGVIGGIQHGLEDFGNKVRGELNDFKNEAESKLNEAKNTLESVPDKVEEVAETAVKEVLGKVLHETAEQASKLIKTVHSGLQNVPEDLQDDLNDLEVHVSLSVITLKYSNFYDRVDDLVEKLANPPTEITKANVLQFITDTAPTRAEVGIQFELITNSLSVSAGCSIPSSLIIHLVDHILTELGID